MEAPNGAFEASKRIEFRLQTIVKAAKCAVVSNCKERKMICFRIATELLEYITYCLFVVDFFFHNAMLLLRILTFCSTFAANLKQTDNN